MKYSTDWSEVEKPFWTCFKTKENITFEKLEIEVKAMLYFLFVY